MKIDDMYKHMSLLNNSTEMTGVRRADTAEDGVQQLQESRKTGTKVDLSDASVEFSKAAAMIDQESTERTDKVNQLKAKIMSGEYEVDTTRVADKILKESIFDFMKS